MQIGSNIIMKKLTFIFIILITGLLTGCSPASHHISTENSYKKIAKHSNKKQYKSTSSKINLHKKYKGFKLTTVPTEYRGTWYRADPYSKKATKLVITSHTFNGYVTYQKTDPNLKLDHNSEKQNKEYAGNAIMISTENGILRERGFLDTVDMVYKLGQFKGKNCLFMSYGTNSNAINGAAFKDKNTALKYRRYDFSKVKQ